MLFKHNLTYGKFFSPDGDGGGGAGAGSSTGDGNNGNAGDTGSGDGDDDSDDGADETSGLKSALEAERKSRKQFEKDLKAARKELADLQNAGKSEDEQATSRAEAAEARVAELEGKLREKAGKAAVTSAATKANAIDVDAVFALVSSKLDYDDDGEPTNVDDVLATAKTDHPKLFRAAAGQGDGGKRASTDANVKPGVERMSNYYATSSKTAAQR